MDQEMSPVPDPPALRQVTELNVTPRPTDGPIALMVAATGGHLAELVRLAPRLTGIPRRMRWVTFDSPQSRVLLANEDAVFVTSTGPRDYRNLVRNVNEAQPILRDPAISAVVSTGAAVAMAFMPFARARGIRCHYIECSARTEGPSVTGRLLGAVPGVHRYSQHRAWASRRWHYSGSVFDGFQAEAIDPAMSNELSVVVTIGTQQYPFTRLIDRLAAVLPSDAKVFWQIGHTDVSQPLPGEVVRFVGPDELTDRMRMANVVVAHAGIGSALAALTAGTYPLLIPRLQACGEHVDDHQLQIARDLSSRGLALNIDAGALTLAHLLSASKTKIIDPSSTSPFALLP